MKSLAAVISSPLDRTNSKIAVDFIALFPLRPAPHHQVQERMFRSRRELTHTFPMKIFEGFGTPTPSRCAAQAQVWCGIVSNCCCDVSAASAAVFEPSAAPLPPPKPAMACRSGAAALELPMDPVDAVGALAAKPPSCQPKPADPSAAAP